METIQVVACKVEFEDIEGRPTYRAYLPDGEWFATYVEGVIPPPGYPAGRWDSPEQFIAWIKWARS